MDLAKCLLDKQVYNAWEFSKLSDLNKKRKYLVCNECNNPAYFKKQSKSGQAACFGARPHKDNCSLISQDSDSSIGTLDNTEKKLVNSGEEIQIDFDFNIKTSKHIIEGAGNDELTKKIGSRHSSINGVGKAKSIRKLSSLLNILMHNLEFAKSNRKIDIGNKYPYNASTIFKKFGELSTLDIGKTRGVYGQIFDINSSKDGKLWINSGGYDDCSIVILSEYLDRFFDRFKKYKGDIDELNGKYVLCFGLIKKSKNDKFYIKLNDISQIVFK